MALTATQIKTRDYTFVEGLLELGKRTKNSGLIDLGLIVGRMPEKMFNAAYGQFAPKEGLAER